LQQSLPSEARRDRTYKCNEILSEQFTAAPSGKSVAALLFTTQAIWGLGMHPREATKPNSPLSPN
jgi:hypothetical protein